MVHEFTGLLDINGVVIEHDHFEGHVDDRPVDEVLNEEEIPVAALGIEIRAGLLARRYDVAEYRGQYGNNSVRQDHVSEVEE